MFNYTLTSEKAKAIHLPSVGPMFIFVLGVRLELAREWLSVRFVVTRHCVNEL